MSGLRSQAERSVTFVLIPNELLAHIRSKAPTSSGHNEQGGLLLGHRKCGALELTGATFPSRWDHATPTLFKRSQRGHRISALREWVRSGQTVDWLSEWHTHPGGIARPSFTDLQSWRLLGRHTKQPMTFIIFDNISIYVGLQVANKAMVKRLQVAERDQRYSLYS